MPRRRKVTKREKTKLVDDTVYKSSGSVASRSDQFDTPSRMVRPNF